MAEPHHERVLVVDFGSQVTQLIARRLREAQAYCEIHPYDRVDAAFLAAFRPKAIILSGGPSSVTAEGSPRADSAVFSLGVPVFGICYGQQTMVEQLGGAVEAGDTREFGRAALMVKAASPLFDGWAEPGAGRDVWMSHGDHVARLPDGFAVIAASSGAPFAAIADETRGFYGVQFHPEVIHTTAGEVLLRNFLFRVAGLRGDWSMAAYRDEIGRAHV